MEERSFWTYVKIFLLSNVNKQLFTFLFFLMLSAIFWLILTLNEGYEKELKIPVRVVNIPKNVMLTSPSVDTVRATVRDQGWVLLNYMFGGHNHTVKVDFKSYDKTFGKGIVPNGDLKRLIEQSLESSSKVTAVKPEKLEYDDAKPDYVGHEISEEFVIGYGLDFDGFVRNLDAIYKVKE